MNKITVFVKLLLAFRFSNYRVLGNIVCEPCQCCKDNTCPNSWNEECTSGCLEKYTGATCQDKCPDNCESCHQYSASICSQCKAGYYTGPINGQWIGNCSLPCPNNCISCTSGTSCSSCKDGFYNGFNSIPYRNCSLTCYSGCKACTLYDVCTECKDGYFGRSQAGYSCQHNCSDGCIDNICNKDNGNCDCKTRFWGENCSEQCRTECNTCENYDDCGECINGFYGPSCEHYCSDGCMDNMCNKDTGSCDCKSTYWGEYCEKACSKGCNSSECFNDTGKCMSGCEEGYTGHSCDTCINGFFGENRSSICPAYCVRDKTCSNKCTDSSCSRLTGECDRGCKENYWGRRCENACSRNCKEVTGKSKCDESNGHCLAGCIEGYFSEQCDKNCSINCFNSSCDNKGRCSFGCTGEYEDDLCLQAKIQMTEGNGGRAAIIGGSVSGALIMIIIIGVVVAVVFLKRRERTDEESKEENNTVVYCNVNNRGHLNHPETKEVDANQSQTAQTSNIENLLVAQKRSVTECISNVYEKIVIIADSREYSTLSYDTTQSHAVFLDDGFRSTSELVATKTCQAIYEQPIKRADIVEYSKLEHDKRQTARGYSFENKDKLQDSAFGTGSAVTESELHN